MHFEDWLERKEPEHRESLELVSRILHEMHPAIRIEFKWGLPVFVLKKNVAYLDVQKNRPLVGIMYTYQIPGMEQLTVKANRKLIGHFYLDGMSQADLEQLYAILDLAVSHDLAR